MGGWAIGLKNVSHASLKALQFSRYNLVRKM